VKRGEIYWADFSPRSGSEQRGRRPAIVISHDAFNQTASWRSTIVIPLSTSPAQSARGPTTVPLPEGAGGLPRPSLALCHQITTLDRGKLSDRLGTLPRPLLLRVEEALRAAVDLE
jgi:mRNA interferase MazF